MNNNTYTGKGYSVFFLFSFKSEIVQEGHWAVEVLGPSYILAWAENWSAGLGGQGKGI